MNIKKYKIYSLSIFNFIFYALTSLGAEFDLDELNNLKDIKAITQEEYDILRMELLEEGNAKNGIYTLKINGKSLSKNYKVIVENGKEYLELQEFFAVIGFTNYYPKKNEILIYLGENLEEINLNYNSNKVFLQGEEIFSEYDYPKFIRKNSTLYIEKEIFKELFLIDLRSNISKLEIAMELGFTPPIAIDQLLDISLAKLEKKDEENEIIFGSQRELFNLGYLRVEGGNAWTRTEENSHYKSDWDAKLSYQGGLLFGELQLAYDFKEKEFKNFHLDYDDIWKNHTLEIRRDNFTSDGEWGFHFYKDRGYYNTGDTIIIREKVPIGSRAELLYMGTAIAIEDEENGEVIFSNNMIRSDRDYQLKIYYPDGKIIMKNIRTSEDYNKQQKGEIEYDISLDENSSENAYTTNANFYYGFTDKFTFGAGFKRDIIKNIDLEKDYMTTVNGELIYGDTLNGYSYTLQLSGEKTLDSYKDSSSKNLEDRNKYSYLFEVTKDKVRTKFEQTNYDKYYEEKRENRFEISYNLTDALRIEYNYDDRIFRKNSLEEKKSKEKNSLLGISYDKTIAGILFGASADFDLEEDKNNEYNFNMYYGGFKTFTTRLENTWTNNGKDYEVALELYNNNLGGFLDISAEVRYSNIKKETFGLKFSIALDSWFTFDVDGDEHGNNSMRVGVDKIIDLKNPSLKIDNMDISRANITTFIDENNNNQYDKGEGVVEGVEVNIGTHRVVTDKNGKAKIYNLSNGIIYELKPTIKKPSYTMGNNIIKIQSKFSSDVDVYIPIKPMLNLSGKIVLSSDLNIPKNRIEEVYSDIIIQVLDMNGKEIDLASPDNTGYFDISGLFSKEYIIKIHYIGNRYNISDTEEKLELKYDKNNQFDYQIQLNISTKGTKILMKKD